MHENVGDGPKPPERDFRKIASAAAQAAQASKDSGQLTPPTMECLEPEERAKLAEATAGILSAIKSESETLLDAALNQFASLGAHSVGHGLNGMMWSGFQAALVVGGQAPHDVTDAMVIIAPEPGEEVSEGDLAITEMLSEFVRATMAGAHAHAIEVWAAWVETIGNDWGAYQKAIGAALMQMLFFAHSRLAKDEAASEMMGKTVYSFVPACDHDHGHGEG